MTARWRPLALTALLAFVWLAATAGMRPLMLPDEGRYVGVAWDMLNSGHWLTPMLDGLPFFHKPPLFYWITAAAIGVFGHNDLVARAGSLVGAWLGAMALYLFLLRRGGAVAARWALVVLLLQPMYLLGAQYANLDMLVAGLITAATVLLADAALAFEAGEPWRGAQRWAYAVAALGLLAKGLIGAVIPALVIVAWLLLRGRWRTLLALWSWSGLLLFIAVAAPWFLAMERLYPGYLHYFFVVQHFERFAAGGFNNVEPFWFYPAVLALFSLPWLPWLGWRRQLPPGGPVRSLMVVWVAAVVLFFSWPQSKLVGYVLPALPPLAALFAEGCAALVGRSRRARSGWWASVTLSVLTCAAVVATLTWHPQRSTREIAATLAARRGAGEPVLMLESFAYDLAWYARLPAPSAVVDDWPRARASGRDDWHLELLDAADFDPASGRQRLLDTEAARRLLCAAPVAWVLGPDAVAKRPLLAQAELVQSVRGTRLWRLRGGGPGCADAASPARPVG